MEYFCIFKILFHPRQRPVFCHIYRKYLRFCHNFRQYSTETIFNLSTPLGKSGVAVVRISGPDSLSILSQLSGCVEFEERKMKLVNIYDPTSGSLKQLIDTSMAVYFKSIFISLSLEPNSFTGEDIVELHTHGSVSIISKLLSVLSVYPNSRASRPGEFTQQAFYNGKLDLTEVEGLDDLLNAETDAQRIVALAQLKVSIVFCFFTGKYFFAGRKVACIID